MRRLDRVLWVAASLALVGCQMPGSRSAEKTPSDQQPPASAAKPPETRAEVPPEPLVEEAARAPEPAPPARTRSAGRVSRDAEPPQSFEVARPAPRRTPEPEDREVPRDEPRAEAPTPRPDPLVLPGGTDLTLVLENALSSATSEVGQRVTARVSRATSEDGRVVLPGGSYVTGEVTEAAASGRVKGKARLAVRFTHIVVRGESHRLEASPLVVEAESTVKRDVKVAGGATAAGAIIGAIIGGGKGAAKGAAVGAAAGTGAVLATKGKEVEMAAGSKWTVRLREGARIQ